MLLPLTPFVLILGLGNGLFSIAAVSTMMRLSTETQDASRMHAQGIKPGLKMGLWGAAQAVAFGLGGVVGTAVSDLSLRWMDSVSSAYSMVFALEALVFLSASVIAWRFKKLNVGTLDQPNSTTVAQGTSPLTLKAI
jgi:BCD family chlorophyll transporter-like MFS transporter